ncbi:methyltransferase domain-containing protein [Jiella endophytica]|uniref:Methyltransferase domain-containing protein n=1 Tax=Jiella endophytica TaxID=2558362 RepID=A0A4Y8RL11_9HYPH|nr:methyltransferase [Jiella endophytica]TFF22950.1 methyltransferase domain-containing protein [Jiella endophytica]
MSTTGSATPLSHRPSGWAAPIRELRRFFRPSRDRWRDFRNRKLADPAFQQGAARFWLTRPFARRSSRRLFDLVAGFVYSQALAAAVELGLFDRLKRGPRTLPEIAAATDLAPEAAERLLRALAAIDLVEIDDSEEEVVYGLGPLGAALVGNPGAEAMIRHHKDVYRDLSDPVALLKGNGPPTRLSKLWPYAAAPGGTPPGDGDVAAYTDLMAASQDIVAEEVLGSYDLSWAKRMLDLGGGDGRFLRRVAARHPDIELHLMELPAVAEIARQRIGDTRFGRRITVHQGDFFTDPFPEGGFDLVTLVRILHDHEDAEALKLLTRAREVLRPGGVVLVAEPMAGSDDSAAIADAYFGFYLLAMGRGRPRTPREIGRLMSEAGLSRIHEVPTALPVATGMVLGEIPRRNVAFT